MFRPDNKDDVKKAYDYLTGRGQDFWTSSLYSNFRTRYEKRRDAYYMRPDANTPKWRSRLTFATYFLSAKMLEAQLAKSYSSTPFTTIQLQAGSLNSPEVSEKLKLVNFDVNRDLNTSRFLVKFDRMRWFMGVSGIGIAREYFGTKTNKKTLRRVETDAFGLTKRVGEEVISRDEHTVTEIIHPLNFAQEPTVHEIRDARWSAVRFPLKVVDLYRMKGNPNYNQEEVEKVIEKIERGGAPTIENTDDLLYYYDNYWDRNDKTNNSIVCHEYCSDLNYKGNYDDNNLYHALILPQYQATIQCRKSPFGFKNHWKIAPYPDAEAPYGIDPNAAVLPIWQFNNDFLNQYMDYVRSSMRVMYEVYDGNILGGLESLINGQTFGFAIADSADAYKENPNGLIRPVRKDQTGIPGFQDMVNYMDRYTAQVQPASNLKGTSADEQLNKTATGIGFQASREDAWTSMIRGPIDNGLQDGLHQKLENRLNFTTEEVTGEINNEQYRYFPFELGGPNYEFEINKQPPDVLVGRIQQALQIAGQFYQQGMIEPAGMAQLLKKMFELSGVPGAADMVRDTGMPPMIMNAQGGTPEQPNPEQGPVEQGTNPAVEAGVPGTKMNEIKSQQAELQEAAKAGMPQGAGVGGALALA